MNACYFFPALLSTLMLFSIALSNPPSTDPPGELEIENVPQFVVVGFDDNISPEGVKWILDFLESKINPAGIGNNKTFDGSPVLVSFYSISGILQRSADLVKQHKRALQIGHEIGNHTHRHISFGCSLFTVGYSTWHAHIDSCSQTLARLLHVDKSAICGFRAPALEFSDTTFRVLCDSGFLYDCSVQEGYQSWQNGTNCYWFYSMENGSPGWNDVWVRWNPQRTPVSSHPGLWQVPLYAYSIPRTDAECCAYGIKPGLNKRIAAAHSGFKETDSKITGSDYGMWFRYGLKPNEVAGILKFNLDKRSKGNRAPLTFGAHTQFYTESYAGHFSDFSPEEMRDAIENFFEYALSKPEVRITTARNVIKWCSHPSGLNEITHSKNSVPKDNNLFQLITRYFSGSFHIAVPANGTYTVSICTINGRKLFKSTETFHAQQFKRITISSTVAVGGIFVISMEGEGIKECRRIVIPG